MTTFLLKIIALISMFIDHTGVVLSCYPRFAEIGGWCRVIGRAAFPIYVFLISEGMKRTSDSLKYLIRLLLFAAISFVPFSLFVSRFVFGFFDEPVLLFTQYTNVFLTLFLGALASFMYDKLRHTSEGLALASAALCVAAAYFLKTDYGAAGVLMIFFAFAFEDKWHRTLAIAAGVVYLYAMSVQYSAHYNYYTIYLSLTDTGKKYLLSGAAACLLIFLYNGEPGERRFKWLFYIFYPAHLIVLFLFSYLIAA